ncbi:techylectin-like protein [Parasteatoda tepidariorum]|uniref:techylectin-like protein n=1 Tax=Parasteatoda tepidariorum TaxID=114398 RepID=UPI00077FD421|nr:techylectin-like protein [Parasteatoda tepidariorum]
MSEYTFAEMVRIEESLPNMKSFTVVTIIILFLSICNGKENISPACPKYQKTIPYLDIAVEMIDKAKEGFVSNLNNELNLRDAKPVDCEELLKSGTNKSGVYVIWPRNRIIQEKPLDVYCDMITDGGGWTVIQRRKNFSMPRDYFFREWSSYKTGFGDMEKEFWLGNDNIFGLTNQRLYSVRFDLKDMAGESRYALYDRFWIDDEDHFYTLHIAEYSGNAGDSMIEVHNNMKFSTKDKDNDVHKENCAQMFKGGWWYGGCHHSNLNGLNLQGKHDSYADGVNWKSFRGHNESLEFTEIKIRPKNFMGKPSPTEDYETPK